MRTGLILFATLLCALLANQVSANCLCAEKGTDYCNCKGAIRPVPKLLERLKSDKFEPIGDSCWCGKQLVEPAVPPKPPCKTVKECKCKCSQPPPMPACYETLPPQQKVIVPAGVPADPISISLALRAGKAFDVPEAQLSYGPANAPLNGVKNIYYSKVPEEKLYALNSQVIELKRRQPKKQEIIVEEEEEEEDVAPPQPYLTYQELGYGPERFKNPRFMRYSSYAQPTVIVKKQKCASDCGFKPGKISQNAKVEEAYIYGDDCL